MKTFYIALGVIVILLTGIKLHAPIKLLLPLLAAALVYLNYPAICRHFKIATGRYDFRSGSLDFQAPPTLKKSAFAVAGVVIAIIAIVRLHIHFKFALLPLAVAILYVYYPLLQSSYHNNALPYHQDSSELSLASQPLAKNPAHVALAMVLAFMIAFRFHLKILMYPLAAAIFYLYVPLLYTVAKKYVLQYQRDGEPANYFAYFWFSVWFGCAGFFSYMLSHLVTDIISSFNLHIFRYLLIISSLSAVAFCVYLWFLQKASTQNILLADIRTNFEKQGRLAGFVILLLMVSYFLLKH